MTGYVVKIGEYHYFTDINKKPDLNSFVIQGKVDALYFYTNDKTPTNQWFSNNFCSRKFKIDIYTRQVVLTDDPKLKNVTKFDFTNLIFNKIKTISL